MHEMTVYTVYSNKGGGGEVAVNFAHRGKTDLSGKGFSFWKYDLEFEDSRYNKAKLNGLIN